MVGTWKKSVYALGFAVAPVMPCFAAEAAPSATPVFTTCPDEDDIAELAGTLCARVWVPLDHRHADAGSIELFVRKFPANDSEATLWAIAGGPGESGASLYPFVGTLRQAFPDHDIVIPDHRGTGYSSRICEPEETAGSAGGLALEGAEWGTCFGGIAADPDRIRQFTITNAAEDLHLLLASIKSTGPVQLYGVSYGTQLVLRAATLRELPVEQVILDSLVPPQDDPRWDLSQRSAVTDVVGRKVLRACADDEDCGALAGGDPVTGYVELIRAVSESPESFQGIPEGQAKKYFASLLDHPGTREWIIRLIGEFRATGALESLPALEAELTALRAEFGDYPQAPNSIPLVTEISASENTLRPELTAEELAAEEAEMLFTSPLPGLLIAPRLPLYPRDEYFGQAPTKLPQTLVLQGTLDPKTPYEGALDHVARLEGAGDVAVATIHGAPHFVLWTAPTCFIAAVRTAHEEGLADSECGR